MEIANPTIQETCLTPEIPCIFFNTLQFLT
jgi:hypothetical protein